MKQLDSITLTSRQNQSTIEINMKTRIRYSTQIFNQILSFSMNLIQCPSAAHDNHGKAQLRVTDAF